MDSVFLYYRENISISYGELTPTGKTTQGKQILTVTVTYYPHTQQLSN